MSEKVEVDRQQLLKILVQIENLEDRIEKLSREMKDHNMASWRQKQE